VNRPGLFSLDTTGTRKKVSFRPYGGNGKTWSESIFAVIDLNLLDVFFQHLVDQECHLVDLKHLIRFFWLVQSQAEGGTASPTWRHIDSQGALKIVLFQIFLNFFDGFVTDLNHGFLLFGVGSC